MLELNLSMIPLNGCIEYLRKMLNEDLHPKNDQNRVFTFSSESRKFFFSTEQAVLLNVHIAGFVTVLLVIHKAVKQQSNLSVCLADLFNSMHNLRKNTRGTQHHCVKQNAQRSKKDG